jgi:hypothetical protein
LARGMSTGGRAQPAHRGARGRFELRLWGKGNG